MPFSSLNTANSAATVASLTVTKPPLTRAGSILLFGISWDAAGASFTWPAGFVPLFTALNLTVDGQTFQVALKVAGANEPASYTITPNASNTGYSFVAEYWGCDSSQPNVAVTTVLVDTPSGLPGNINLPTQTPLANMCDLIGIYAGDGPSGAVTGFTPPAGWTERLDGNDAAFNSISFADTRWPISGQPTGTVVASVQGAGTVGWAGVMIALGPIVGALYNAGPPGLAHMARRA